MASMNLQGPYNLTFDSITKVVKPHLPGVFALGYTGEKGIFFVNYVGRSDNDVRARLLDSIGSDVAFKFEVSSSAHAAFLRECELFHSFRPRGNRVHPSRAAVSDWSCPKCGFLAR